MVECYETLRGRFLGIQLKTEVDVREMFQFRSANLRITSKQMTMEAMVANEDMRETELV